MRDACRYVDDLRFVVEADTSFDLPEVEAKCHEWIEQTLQRTAPGLTANRHKTRAVAVHDSKRVMVFQSRRMRRIQETVSGGFDAHGGTQLLASLEGLFNTIGQFVETDENGTRWPLKAVPDVRDETVARFVAGRYRSTFRALRPLLEDEILPAAVPGNDNETPNAISAVLTKDELDRQCQAFGLRLIEEWIRNPGNVRLLRVGLDLFPDASVLESVLDLLRPITASPPDELRVRFAAEYCLAEIFRAAATETGLVPDSEFLPADIDLNHYRDVLRDYARDLLADAWNSLAWYLQQQILLFMANSSPVGIDCQKVGSAAETEKYASFIAFLQGQPESDLEQWAVNGVLARQSYLSAEDANRLIVPQMTAERISRIADMSPSFAEELLLNHARLHRLADKAIRDRLSLPKNIEPTSEEEREVPLVSESRRWNCRLRDELNLVRFALQWLEHREQTGQPIPPSMIEMSFAADRGNISTLGDQLTNSLFEAPSWCPEMEKWRFELGFVLRFIITGQSDPTEMFRHPSWRDHENCYRPPPWHWQVRQYSLYNGRDRLGPEWIPISSWMESFLCALLHWPGALQPRGPFQKRRTISRAKKLCHDRIRELVSIRGKATGLLMLDGTPWSKWRGLAKKTKPLRICVAQLAVPEFRDGRPTASFGPHDPEFNAPATRRMYQQHLTAMLAGVDQMLRVRSTHKESAGLDFLILPELSVHPADVRSRLLPFVRRHGCWVFAGLTYHRCRTGGPLVNSGMWVVPETSPSGGVLYRIYEQGKQHLAPDESSMLAGVVQGHRPCQWLMRWRWSSNRAARPVTLSGSICYDATDLSLVADLKNVTDIYAIPALNRDVGTFDRMTDALHYHMYQMVILANHAHFGGSNAYVPYREQFQKQVFHLHGQDETIVAFLDIADPSELLNRGSNQSETRASRIWKTPPADWRSPGG